jgi:hypothetical protein
VNPPGLQPGAINHSTTPAVSKFDRAGEGTRTPDPRFTKPLLYQLSYTGRLRLAIRDFRQNANTSNTFAKTQAAAEVPEKRTPAAPAGNKLIDVRTRQTVG